MVGILMLNTIWVTLLYRSQAGREGIVECVDCYDHFYTFSFNYNRVEVFVLLDILFFIFKHTGSLIKNAMCVSSKENILPYTKKTSIDITILY